MRTLRISIALFALLTPSCLFANDILVSAATLFAANTSAGANNPANYTNVRFNLSWSNSWRVNTGPSNWDAAWIFVKYRVEGGTGCTASNWQPATLSTTNANHSITTDNGTPGTINATSDGRGVFMYRSGNGTGNINWQQVVLRWQYGTDGVLDACNVSVKVFAVEMVYVPQSAFFVGDGGSSPGKLTANTTTSPFQVTSEGALTLGGGGAGSVGNGNKAGESGPTDDFDNTTSVTLPAAFPKGFAPFYSMKYEISQEQYMEFLNTLTVIQQLSRHGATVANRFWGNSAAPSARNGVKCVILPTGSTPGTYACDLNNNGTVNENGDGQNIAMQGMQAADFLAYLDWAALRPATELEYEKSGRGTLPSVANEYAWGSTSLYATSYSPLINGGMGSEVGTSPSTTVGNAVYSGTNGSISGPMRVGSFATSSSSRVVAGAGYYGIMELTGNVWELVVGIGLPSGRSFTGVHGNGVLSTNGLADVDFWPGSNGNATTAANTIPNAGSSNSAGLMFRGGSFQEASYMRLSDRAYPGWTGLSGRDNRNGGRGVRTAP